MFIVIEGLDGSGKSTQLKFLQDFLRKKNIPYEYLHFPRLDTPLWGDLISRFLRGEFGENNNVNPYLVALIYALDRNDAKEMINGWLKSGKLVILDRYVNSNIAYQCAKLTSQDEKKALMKWILEMEYTYNNIPQPDLNIFLDVPFSFVERKLKDQRKGDDRNYLRGAKDIHESDISFQSKVRDVYCMLAETDSKVKLLNCAGPDNNMLNPGSIFEKIVSVLTDKKII
jgi:dTMP kinase